MDLLARTKIHSLYSFSTGWSLGYASRTCIRLLLLMRAGFELENCAILACWSFIVKLLCLHVKIYRLLGGSCMLWFMQSPFTSIFHSPSSTQATCMTSLRELSRKGSMPMQKWFKRKMTAWPAQGLAGVDPCLPRTGVYLNTIVSSTNTTYRFDLGWHRLATFELNIIPGAWESRTRLTQHPSSLTDLAPTKPDASAATTAHQ